MGDASFLDREGGRLAYDLAGAGPLVVCVPSMGDLRQEYRFLGPALVAAGFRVARMDLRGLGESSPYWDDYSVAGVGSDIVALIEHLGSGPAIVAADSMGAGAAIWAAAERPELVERMVFFGPAVRGEVGFLGRILYRTLLAKPWAAAFWKGFYGSLYPGRKPADLDAYLAALYGNLKESGRTAAFRRMAIASKAESERRIPRVTAPTLILMGTADPDFKSPEAEARRLAEELGGTFTMISGAGHYPHAEFPEIVTPLVIDFLKAVGNKGSGRG